MFKEGVRAMRSHPALMLILGTAALHGASTEGFDRLADLHILRDIGLPAFGQLSQLWWFAILDGGSLAIGFAALIVVRRRATLEGHVPVARILALIDVLLVVSVVVFAVTGRFWVALAAMWIVGALRSVREPVFTVWINQGLDPKTRATINSVGGQADAVGQAAGGPMLGAIGGSLGVPVAIVASALLQLPTLLLYRRAIRKGTVGTLPPDEIDPVLELEDEAL
jgi:DHA3 family tetracycline resistance protein-like MFS transporter